MKTIKEISLIKDRYGSEITLYDDNDNEIVFHLIVELSNGEKNYVYLQSIDNTDGDIEVLEIVKDNNDELDLLSIEDDDEWENAEELFDEWTYSRD